MLPRQCILIVCEGEKTEPNYFKAFRAAHKLASIEVEIIASELGSAPISIVDHALDVAEQRSRDAKESVYVPAFDEVWCVFDREGTHENRTFNQAVSKADSSGLELAVSNPAFEYWYLLHFEETDRPFQDCAEVIRSLKRHIPGYEKNQDVFGRLVAHTGTAVNTAERLWYNRPDPHDKFPNSSTLVYRLVQKLQSMSVQRQ